ncbi:MAG: hypothetical protein R2844_19635 [Caldilineales bacterium]
MSVQLPTQPIETTDTHTSYRQRVAAGVALIAIGLLIAANQIVKINMEGWVFFEALAVVFLAWGCSPAPSASSSPAACWAASASASS